MKKRKKMIDFSDLLHSKDVISRLKDNNIELTTLDSKRASYRNISKINLIKILVQEANFEAKINKLYIEEDYDDNYIISNKYSDVIAHCIILNHNVKMAIKASLDGGVVKRTEWGVKDKKTENGYYLSCKKRILKNKLFYTDAEGDYLTPTSLTIRIKEIADTINYDKILVDRSVRIFYKV